MDDYTETLRRTLVETSSLGDDRTQEVARSLTAALDPALRLVVLQMLTDAADEINSGLDHAHVAVVMDGSRPHLLVTQVDPSAGQDQDSAPALDDRTDTPVSEVSETQAGPEVRTTLRLPDSLKQQIDAAARAQGCSVNAWLVEAARTALVEQTSASGSRRSAGTWTASTGGPDGAATPSGWRTQSVPGQSSGSAVKGWFG